MFREKLKKDLDGISPDEALLSKISLMMSEETEKTKQPIYMSVVKWGGVAAAICLVAVGAVSILGIGKDSIITDTAVADAAGFAAADNAAYENSTDAADGATYLLDMTAGEACEEEKSAADESDDSVEAVSEEAYTGRFGGFNFDLDPSTVQLNENPDLSKKTIPEGYAVVEYNEPETVSNLVDINTDIVIVKITDRYETNDYSFTGDEETDNALAEKWQSDPLTSGAAICYAQAEAIVESELFLAGDAIPVFMPYGSFGAKLENEKYYLLVIAEYENGIFKLYNGAESVFEIKDDNTIVSQSHFRVPSMLDGLTVEEAAAVLKYEQELKKQ